MGVLGIVSGAYPVILEAVLSAKEAAFDSQLHTCWTLQRPRVIGTVNAETLLLARRFRAHSNLSMIQ